MYPSKVHCLWRLDILVINGAGGHKIMALNQMEPEILRERYPARELIHHVGSDEIALRTPPDENPPDTVRYQVSAFEN